MDRIHLYIIPLQVKIEIDIYWLDCTRVWDLHEPGQFFFFQIKSPQLPSNSTWFKIKSTYFILKLGQMCCTSHRGSGDLFMCMVISFFFIPYILKNMLWTMPLSSQQLKWRSGLLSCVGFLPPLFFGDLHYYNVVKRNTGMIYCVHPFRLVMT